MYFLRGRYPVDFCPTQSVPKGAGNILRIHHGQFCGLCQRAREIGCFLVLVQERESHQRNLSHVDHCRSKRAAKEVEKQEAAQSLGLFFRVGDVVEQLHRFPAYLPAVLVRLFCGLPHVVQVVIARRVPGVRDNELRQSAAHVTIEPRRALSVHQALHHASIVEPESQEFLERFETFRVHVFSEQLHRFEVQPGIELVLLRVHGSGGHRPVRMLFSDLVGDLVGLILPRPRDQRNSFVHPEEFGFALFILGCDRVFAKAHQREIAMLLKERIFAHQSVDVIDRFVQPFDCRLGCFFHRGEFFFQLLGLLGLVQFSQVGDLCADGFLGIRADRLHGRLLLVFKLVDDLLRHVLDVHILIERHFVGFGVLGNDRLGHFVDRDVHRRQRFLVELDLTIGQLVVVPQLGIAEDCAFHRVAAALQGSLVKRAGNGLDVLVVRLSGEVAQRLDGF